MNLTRQTRRMRSGREGGGIKYAERRRGRSKACRKLAQKAKNGVIDSSRGCEGSEGNTEETEEGRAGRRPKKAQEER